jgi:acetylornithine deacetylase/succinyl-diaminopimelate desuccinylase-like protein
VQLLHTLHDADGRVLVGGFYDEVVELSAEERNAIDEVPFDAEAYRQSIGLTNDALIGEPGYTTYERAWVRPTLEINGIWGGYQGDGVKTVIPAKAHAKLTCRLVAAQEPTEVLASIEAHIERYRPPGTRINVIRFAGMARAYALPADHPGAQAVAEVLTAAYGTAPHYVRAGGTLPIMDMFLRELNAYTIDVGFGLEDERAHSPNEFFRLANFARGQILYGSLLERLGSLEV